MGDLSKLIDSSRLFNIRTADALHGFFDVAGEDDGVLIRKSTKDLWALEKTSDGKFQVRRLFDSGGKPIVAMSTPVNGSFFVVVSNKDDKTQKYGPYTEKVADACIAKVSSKHSGFSIGKVPATQIGKYLTNHNKFVRVAANVSVNKHIPGGWVHTVSGDNTVLRQVMHRYDALLARKVALSHLENTGS